MNFIRALIQRIDSMFLRGKQDGWSADRFWFHISYGAATYAVLKLANSVADHPSESLIYAMCVLILIYLSVVAGSKIGSKILFLIAQIRIGNANANQDTSAVAVSKDDESADKKAGN